MDHRFDLREIEPWEAGAIQHVIKGADAGDGGVHGGEGKVGAKKQLVPKPYSCANMRLL